MRKRLTQLALICLAALSSIAFSASHPARADEGMWPLNALPLQQLRVNYHFTPSQAWVQHIQHSCVRFRGACGSFVSSDGLIMTNDHVADEPAAILSGPGKDYVTDGFYAPSLSDELKIPGYTLYVLEDTQDVTAGMTAGQSGLSPAKALQQRVVRTAQLESAAEKQGFEGDIVELYGGAQYWLYRYKSYTDVRLVMTPQHQMGQLGGNADNFEYPRYNYDVSFVRVYENGKPAHTPDYLKFSAQSIADGQLVFAFGTPYDTSRYDTMSEMMFDRDIETPDELSVELRQHYLLNQYSEQGPEAKRFADDQTPGLENDIKVGQGILQGLQDPAIIAAKAAQEEMWEKELKPYPADYAKLLQAEEQLRSITGRARNLALREDVLRDFSYFSRVMGTTIRLVRILQEARLPERDRLEGFTDAELPMLRRRMTADIPVDKELSRIELEDYLTQLYQTLGTDDPDVRAALRGMSPVARADQAFSNTTMDTAAGRKGLLDGGLPALQNSKDTLVQLALAIAPIQRREYIQYRDQVDLPEQAADAQIARLLLAHAPPGTMYPDASGTLRMTYGVVKGYEQAGQTVPPFTTLGGLYEHAAHFDNIMPYTITPIWQNAKDRLDLNTPFNFVTTQDSTGGNSGSPEVNQSGDIVGILFDGNIQDLIGPYVHIETQGRTVALTSQSILEGLQKVYHYDRLADEIAAGHA